jgi:hypothetical protein
MMIKSSLRLTKLRIVIINIIIIFAITLYSNLNIKSAFKSNSFKKIDQGLFDLLFEINLFLIDIEILKDILISRNSSNLESNYNKIFQTELFVQFGIFDKDFNNLLEQVFKQKNFHNS